MNLHRFETELTRLINKLNIDNDLSTPDFILARMVTGWLDTFAKAKDASRAWHEDTVEKSEALSPTALPIGDHAT